MTVLTKKDRVAISDILERRANEIATYADNYRRQPERHGSVELALSREIERLRALADRINPQPPEFE